MKKTILVLAISVLFFSCGDKSQKKEKVDSTNQEASITNDESEIGLNNYAVTWKWTTSNTELVQENLLTISEELTALWKADEIENVYYNNETDAEKLDYIANISFFLKAHSKENAEEILNKLTIVKKGFATYNLHLVGLLWLDRKSETIYEKGITNSFVTVWKTEKGGYPTEEIVKSQSDAVLKLWDEGKVENVYFDIEGTQKANDNTDFVFFVNTNTEEEAEAICNSLPFYKENIATYKLYPVGAFWMGKYSQN